MIRAKEINLEPMLVRLKTMHPILQNEWAIAHRKICEISSFNEEKINKHGLELRFKPARFDEVQFALLIIDWNMCFVWPFTYRNEDGQTRYVVFNELKDVLEFPEVMKPKIDWIDRENYNPDNYDEIFGGQLSVGNSWNDTLRLVLFMLVNMYRLNLLMLSGDLHPFKGVTNHTTYRGPGNTEWPPFVPITQENLYHPSFNLNGTVRSTVNPDIAWNYYQELMRVQEKQKLPFRLPFVTWPIHGTPNTPGSLIDPLVWKQVLMHSAARNTPWSYIGKGMSPSTEFHGAFGPEVIIKGDPHAQMKKEELELLRQKTYIFVAGQAANYCDLVSLWQLYRYLMETEKTAQKLVVITDLTSFIPNPESEAAFWVALEEMKQNGAQEMNSIEATEFMDKITA